MRSVASRWAYWRRDAIQGQRCTQLYAALVLLMSFAAGLAAPVAAQDDGPEARLVLALYRADITWTTWVEPTCDLPCSLYVSADVSAVERHVREALAVGIDAFVQTWYGPSVAANPTAPNFRTLLEEAALAGFGAAVQVDLSSPLLDTPDEVLGALEALRDDLMRSPGYLVVDSLPVVFFVEQERLSLASWEALRGAADPGRRMIWIAEGPSTEPLEVFDGLYLLDPDRSALPGSLLSLWGSQVRLWEKANGARRYWVATTLPGYDDRLVVGADAGYVLLRNSGATYRDNWAAADASDPDWFLIRSFNEWDHCTHIECSVAYGDSTMALTAEMVRQYRYVAASTTATPTPPEPTVTPTLEEPSESMTSTPVVTVTAEPLATPEITPTATLTPTATPFRLATPTASAAPSATEPRVEVPSVVATAAEWHTAPAGVVTTATPRPLAVVEGDDRPSCLVLPLLLTSACCWGARRRNDRGTGPS